MSRNSDFWDKEYSSPTHLALSNEPAEDLVKFTRWLARAWEKDRDAVLGIDRSSVVLDLGCGNGRNLIYLATSFGCRGIGYDVSGEAVRQAKAMAKNAGLISAEDGGRGGRHDQVEFKNRSIEGSFEDVADESVDLVLDMMTSHFLNEKGRAGLRDEMARVLKPGGWVFFKTFCSDGDLHSKRLLRDNPGEEAGSYIHPKIGVEEHTWSEEEIYEFFGGESGKFEVKKLEKSHRHILHGKAFKRRTVSVYLEKRW
jgi:SAM-dependent methyltransferase